MSTTTKLYANRCGHTDVDPFEVIRVVSEKTMVIREMKAEIINFADLKFIPGGFSAHSPNQREQKWDIQTDPNGLQRTIRKHKDGVWYSPGGMYYTINTEPHKFYDYNF